MFPPFRRHRRDIKSGVTGPTDHQFSIASSLRDAFTEGNAYLLAELGMADRGLRERTRLSLEMDRHNIEAAFWALGDASPCRPPAGRAFLSLVGEPLGGTLDVQGKKVNIDSLEAVIKLGEEHLEARTPPACPPKPSECRGNNV